MSSTLADEQAACRGAPLDRRQRRQHARPGRCTSGSSSPRAAAARTRRPGSAIDLEAQPPAWPQRPIAGLEERRRSTRRRPPRASRSRRWRRSAVDVAVVAQLDVDPVGEPGGAHPLGREAVLRPRDRDRGHATARARRRRTARSRPSRVPISSTCSPAARPGRSAITGTCGAGRRRADGPARRRPRSSRSASRRGTVGRSRCPGRSARRCCGGSRSSCSGAPRWARVRRSRSGTRHQPSGIASASRLRPASLSSAARSGLDHRPSMYASPAPTSPPSSIRTTAARSWIADLGRVGSRRDRRSRAAARPAGPRSGGRPGSVDAAPSTTRLRPPRPGARAQRDPADAACVLTGWSRRVGRGSSGPSRRPWR